MKKILLSAIIISLISFSVPAMAGGPYILEKGAAICIDLDDMLLLSEAAADGDAVLMALLLDNKRCGITPLETEVYSVGMKVLSGVIQLRVAGMDKLFWTPLSFVHHIPQQ
jgi:hypothetical protein